MISIVIVTFNSRDSLKNCLESIFRQALRNMEVVVVDNGSQDGTIDLIKRQYGQVRLVENAENVGSCKARNQGLEFVSGEWVLTLDSDVVLEDGCLECFVACLDRVREDVGMVQPQVFGMDGETIYSNGIYLSAWKRFFDMNRGRQAKAGLTVHGIIGPCSAAAFYRRSMLEQLKESTGYFDERFFFLVEDVDLAWRACRRGWRTAFYPAIICRHKGNGSGTDKDLRQYLSFRNRRLMILKNTGVLERFMLYLISWPYELSRSIYMRCSNRFMRHGGSLLQRGG
ncbi:MAG: glycosyltransferase family 2 protein [Candidatus Omnitrophica bacterium]|nr:glycosyltransferase family 2 protein [Candidatus Omnitrophota bacterium]